MLIQILNANPVMFILIVIALVFALCIHEFSHGYIAYINGDDTAYKMGRLTLNPLKHLDPIGSLMILFIGFGYAKPVPVNGSNLANPRTDMMKIAFAGPASNILLAVIGGIVLRILIGSSIFYESVYVTLIYFTQINIALAVFNMLPISPLDGSQIFNGYMVTRNPGLVMKLQTYGPQILFGIILIGYVTKFSVIWMIMGPIVKMFMYLFSGVYF